MVARAALVFVGSRRIRYLVTADGPATVSITAIGASSPDLLVDTVAGPLKQIVRSTAGSLAAMSVRIASRSGLGVFAVDVGRDANGRPVLTVTTSGLGAAYLDVAI